MTKAEEWYNKHPLKIPKFNFVKKVLQAYNAGYKEGRKANSDSADFDEWRAINSSEIEELADYFMAHDTEHFFTGDKYKEAYKKIETLCRMAYERK